MDDATSSKKSSHNRRRRRGGRRNSSVHQEIKPIIVVEEVKSDNDRRLSTGNHRRRKSSISTVKPKLNDPAEEKEALAFQSVVDIIHEMKRLPLVSIKPDKHEPNNDSWKRVRRHSEPPQEMKRNQQHVDFKLPLKTINEQQQKHVNNEHGKPVFSNSFLPLESEEGENNNETLVSPLSNEYSNRTRSKSGMHKYYMLKKTFLNLNFFFKKKTNSA